MKISASIELIWQLAGAEAIAGEFSEIQVEHFCLGLLKLADLQVQEGTKLGVNEVVAQVLATEIEAMRRELAKRGIHSTQLRRTLRARVGKGGCPFRGGNMHRAQASRDLFDAAARAAGDAGHDTVTALHLLEAVLNTPTPVLAQVLESVVTGGQPAKSSKTPLLDKHGIDLTMMAAENRLSMPDGCAAECKALLQALGHKDRKSVLLVSAAYDLGRTIIVAAACSLTREASSPVLQRKRLVEVRPPQESDRDGEEVLEFWEQLFAETEAAKDVVLVLPPLDDCIAAGDMEWRDLLRRVLEKRAVQCLCRASVETYNQWLNKDKAISRMAQVIWLHDTKFRSVPREL